MIRTLFSAIADLLVIFIDLGISSSPIEECKEIAEKPFVCPNCGGEFHINWKHLWFKNGYALEGGLSNKAVLKCPHCKEKDACRWTGADRI